MNTIESVWKAIQKTNATDSVIEHLKTLTLETSFVEQLSAKPWLSISESLELLDQINTSIVSQLPEWIVLHLTTVSYLMGKECPALQEAEEQVKASGWVQNNKHSFAAIKLKKTIVHQITRSLSLMTPLTTSSTPLQANSVQIPTHASFFEFHISVLNNRWFCALDFEDSFAEYIPTFQGVKAFNVCSARFHLLNTQELKQCFAVVRVVPDVFVCGSIVPMLPIQLAANDVPSIKNNLYLSAAKSSCEKEQHAFLPLWVESVVEKTMPDGSVALQAEKVKSNGELQFFAQTTPWITRIKLYHACFEYNDE